MNYISKKIDLSVDYTKLLFSERLNIVNQIIDDNSKFLNEYFSYNFKVNLNKKNPLSEFDYVCKSIERLGMYLIKSKDLQSHRKIKYRFWNSNREFIKCKESENISVGDEDVLDYFFNIKNKNFYKLKKTKIYNKDCKDIKEIGYIQNGIKLMKDVINKKKNIDYIEKQIELLEQNKITNGRYYDFLKKVISNYDYYLGNWIRDMEEYQIEIKKSVKKPISLEEKPSLLPNTKNLLDIIDYRDEKTLRVLMEYLSCDNSLQDDLGIIVYDVNNLIDSINLTALENKIIKLFREGFKKKDIPEVLKIPRQTVHEAIDLIIRKMIRKEQLNITKM